MRIFFCLIFFSGLAFSQSFRILSIEGDKVYVDAPDSMVNRGDMLKVLSNAKEFKHPNSGVLIKTDQEVISNLRVTGTFNNYSVCSAFPKVKINSLYDGLEVVLFDSTNVNLNLINTTAEIKINSSKSTDGFLVNQSYLENVLEKEFLKNGEITLIDNSQIKSENTKPSDYIVIASFSYPEITDLSTSVPLKSLLAIGKEISGIDLGIQLLGNLTKKHLVARVKISLKLINSNTGEVVFLCSEEQVSVGKTAIGIEGAVIAGIPLDRGSSDFEKTLIGKSTKKAYSHAVSNIVSFLKGNIKEKYIYGPEYRKQNAIDDFEARKQSGENEYDMKTKSISEFKQMYTDSIIFFDGNKLVWGKLNEELNSIFTSNNEYKKIAEKDIFKHKGEEILKINPSSIWVGNKVVFYSGEFNVGTITKFRSTGVDIVLNGEDSREFSNIPFKYLIKRY